MIARFDPGRREFTPEIWKALPAGASPWFLINGQPVRAWLAGGFVTVGAPWILGGIAFCGDAWLEIPDGAGADGSVRIMSCLIRMPDPCDAETVRDLCMPPAVPTGQESAERLNRELARRKARMLPIWERAHRLPITPPAPAWGLS